MERVLEERLKELVVNLVGQEAKRINCDVRRILRYRRNVKPVSSDMLDRTKKKIYELFDGNYDRDVVRETMIDYLNELIEFVDERANPSFKTLKDRVERGEYDFDFSKHIERV